MLFIYSYSVQYRMRSYGVVHSRIIVLSTVYSTCFRNNANETNANSHDIAGCQDEIFVNAESFWILKISVGHLRVFRFQYYESIKILIWEQKIAHFKMYVKFFKAKDGLWDCGTQTVLVSPPELRIYQEIFLNYCFRE